MEVTLVLHHSDLEIDKKNCIASVASNHACMVCKIQYAKNKDTCTVLYTERMVLEIDMPCDPVFLAGWLIFLNVILPFVRFLERCVSGSHLV
jgi:hypothetical protein